MAPPASHGGTGRKHRRASGPRWRNRFAPLTSVTPNPGYTELEQGNRGDPVLWMQEHLATSIPAQATTGIFDATTAANLAEFQSSHGIAPTGKTEAATWQALLALPPVAVNWTGSGPSGG